MSRKPDDLMRNSRVTGIVVGVLAAGVFYVLANSKNDGGWFGGFIPFLLSLPVGLIVGTFVFCVVFLIRWALLRNSDEDEDEG